MTCEQLKNLACKHFKVTRSQLEGRCRKESFVYARIAVAKILNLSGYTLHGIANELNVNHSSAFHYLKIFNDRMQYDVIFSNTYKQFEEECD